MELKNGLKNFFCLTDNQSDHLDDPEKERENSAFMKSLPSVSFPMRGITPTL